MWKIIEKLLEERGMTKYALAKKAGLKQSLLIDLKAGRAKDIKLATAIKIADALDISLDEFRK